MSETRDGLLSEQAVRIGVHAADKEAAVRACGDLLVEAGAVDDGYVAAMLDREQEISTYMGEGVAIPHGTNAGRALVRRDALAVVRFAEPVDWGEGNEVVLCVAIAALGESHLDILADLAEILLDPERARALRETEEAKDLIRLLEPDDGEGQTQS